MIILTSFKKSKKFKGEKYSVARWQPKGFKYPVLEFLDATDENGSALHFSMFDNPLRGYEKSWEKKIKKNWKVIKRWIDDIEEDENIVLCCWCPFTASSQEQIKKFGSFACHTGLIGKLIKEERPEIRIILDNDRKNLLVKEWRP